MTDDGTRHLLVRATHASDATPQAVFDALLDERRMFATLQASGALGAPQTMLRVPLDPRVGGAFNIVDQQPGADAISYHGTFLVSERPTPIAFS